MTFWDHLDELRSTLLKCVAVVVIAAAVAFCFKEPLFRVVLAPSRHDFVFYQWIGAPHFQLQLINTELTEQFMVHMRIAIYVGILAASPWIVYQFFRFIAPGLYDSELRIAHWIVGSAYCLFALGLLVSYFVVFPLTVRFLGTYQVSDDVLSMLSLNSYIDTLIILSLMLGIVFELPVVSAILARMHLVTAAMLSTFRRQAIVVILIAAAIITPTTDALTLIIVALPIWLLYEVSIIVVKVIYPPST